MKRITRVIKRGITPFELAASDAAAFDVSEADLSIQTSILFNSLLIPVLCGSAGQGIVSACLRWIVRISYLCSSFSSQLCQFLAGLSSAIARPNHLPASALPDHSAHRSAIPCLSVDESSTGQGSKGAVFFNDRKLPPPYASGERGDARMRRKGYEMVGSTLFWNGKGASAHGFEWRVTA